MIVTRGARVRTTWTPAPRVEPTSWGNTMTKKVIAVVGGTGSQGGGLVRAILNDGTEAAREVARQTLEEVRRVMGLGYT